MEILFWNFSLYTILFIIFVISIIMNSKIALINRIIIWIWGLQLLIIPVFLKENFLTYEGIVWILGLVIIAFLAGIITYFLCDKKSSDKLSYIVNTKKYLLYLKLVIILGVLSSVIYSQKLGFNISSYLNLNSLLAISNETAILKYSGEISSNLLDQILLTFVYLSSLMGGFFYSIDKLRRTQYIILSIFPGFFNMIVTNSKAGFLIAIMLLITGFLVGNTYISKKKIKLNISNILKYIGSIMLFLSTLFFSMILRTGMLNLDTISIMKSKFINYSLGHIIAFDYWISNLETSQLYWGTKTFYGISDFLGILSRDDGIYKEIISNGIFKTNVYTAFRPLIEDYSKFGALIVIFIILLFGGIIEKKYYNIKHKKVVIVFNMACVFYFLYSFITTSFAYNSIILTFVLMFLIIVLTIRFGGALDEKN